MDERQDVLSMIGKAFEVQEIDEHGHAWIEEWWRDEGESTCRSHSLALDAHEMELAE